MDVSKLSIGVGVGSMVPLAMADAIPNAQAKASMTKNVGATASVLGAIPLMAAGKVALKALEDLDDIFLPLKSSWMDSRTTTII